MYASFTSALAIITGLIVSLHFFRAFSWSVGIVSTIVALLLSYHARREGKYHREVITSWTEVFGPKASEDYLKQLQQKDVSVEIPAQVLSNN
jgi:hypothetical protein